MSPKVVQAPCVGNGHANQLWTGVSVGGYEELRPLHNFMYNKCLDIHSGSAIQYTCNGGHNQQFSVFGP
jgi:hypothetical protein